MLPLFIDLGQSDVAGFARIPFYLETGIPENPTTAVRQPLLKILGRRRNAMDNSQSIEDRLNQLGEDVVPAGESHESSPMADPSVSQHVVRAFKDDQDILSGEFRVSISADQTISVLHVPLYPPMQTLPEVEAFCDNDAVRIRITDVQRFGVRLEVKTKQADEEATEVIQIQITAN